MHLSVPHPHRFGRYLPHVPAGRLRMAGCGDRIIRPWGIPRSNPSGSLGSTHFGEDASFHDRGEVGCLGKNPSGSPLCNKRVEVGSKKSMGQGSTASPGWMCSNGGSQATDRDKFGRLLLCWTREPTRRPEEHGNWNRWNVRTAELGTWCRGSPAGELDCHARR
eukprot:scaffold741_cov336-Pavlova_lutheri.AAC.5